MTEGQTACLNFINRQLKLSQFCHAMSQETPDPHRNSVAFHSNSEQSSAVTLDKPLLLRGNDGYRGRFIHRSAIDHAFGEEHAA
jgi:hypothetical protein